MGETDQQKPYEMRQAHEEINSQNAHSTLIEAEEGAMISWTTIIYQRT